MGFAHTPACPTNCQNPNHVDQGVQHHLYHGACVDCGAPFPGTPDGPLCLRLGGRYHMVLPNARSCLQGGT